MQIVIAWLSLDLHWATVAVPVLVDLTTATTSYELLFETPTLSPDKALQRITFFQLDIAFLYLLMMPLYKNIIKILIAIIQHEKSHFKAAKRDICHKKNRDTL